MKTSILDWLGAAAALASLAALQSCATYPGDSIAPNRPVYPVPPMVAPSTLPQYPSDHFPMLEDPEAEIEEYEEEVWARDDAEARRLCEQLAANRSSESGTVVTSQGQPTQVTKTRSRTGTFRYVCKLRVEL